MLDDHVIGIDDATAILAADSLDGRTTRDLAPQDSAFDAAGRTLVLVLPPPPASAAVSRVATALDDACGVRLARLRPASGLSAALSASGRWHSVPTGAGAERYEKVLLPAALEGAKVIAVCETGGAFRQSPCGLLASLAHPRQRAALLAGRDPAPAAELAAAVDPAELWLTGSFEGCGWIARTPSLLAAQLLWHAFRTERADSGQSGPWEQPEVQRLAALGLVPRRPEEMSILLLSADRAGFPEALARMLRDRLGPVVVTTGSD